jgi:hypothetical protein
MKVRVLRSAHISIMEGFDFYENQKLGLGTRFIESIMADIRSLRVSGGSHQIVHEDYRRKICNIFPFSIYYKIEHSEVNVYRVLDNRRNPEWVQNKLSNT